MRRWLKRSASGRGLDILWTLPSRPIHLLEFRVVLHLYRRWGTGPLRWTADVSVFGVGLYVMSSIP